MAALEEIEQAVAAALGAGAKQIALLKCTSGYPASPDEMNLRTIPDMAQRFSVPVGISDHTLGIAVPVAAVSMGACVIEKHITLSRSDPGPDTAFSLEPDEFKELVAGVKAAYESLGNVHYGASPREQSSKIFRRSLFAVQDIAQGEPFTAQNVRSIRPGNGLPPKCLPDVIGQRAKIMITRGTPIDFSLILDHKTEG
jgi:N-acetylneuraminate synthase